MSALSDKLCAQHDQLQRWLWESRSEAEAARWERRIAEHEAKMRACIPLRREGEP